MEFEEEDYLAHYGVIRRSGRYPWGSGGDIDITPPRNMSFGDQIKFLKTNGLSESKIAQGFGMTMNQLRANASIESNAARQANIAMAQRLKDKGYSDSAIGRRMNTSESTIRSWLVPGAKDKADVLTNTTNKLRSEVTEKPFLDVGKGVENYCGVARTRMDTALEVLKKEGYEVHTIYVPQTTTQYDTKVKLLCLPGTTKREAYLNVDNIQQIAKYSDNGGRDWGGIHEPILLNPNRVSVVYKEDGGDKLDGVIYLRPGVDDISIGGAKYAQVRAAVGKDHYLKGMAIYKDNLPPGVDVQFHTNKSSTGNKLDALKLNSEERGYIPGGQHVLLKSVKRQITANPGTPHEKVTSAMNLVTEEGQWEDWGGTLSSQMLSKQSPILAKSQLDMTYERRQHEFENLTNLTNATVRKKLLSDFADTVDSSAAHLEAASLPKTLNHVILPIPSMPDNQIYAPKYNNGDRVVLIRHPHGGTFEIPELIVNNKHREAKRLLGPEPRDAVGINQNVAKHLSGADFDGDTVLVIPNPHGRIRSSRMLEGLQNFDPRSEYPGYPGMKRMTNTQNEMGAISNLLTDMSIKNAPPEHLVRAVKHSMVVIDAEKHNLDFRLSANDNGIKDLKKKYQAGGASTLISRAGSPVFIPQRKERTAKKGGPINIKTGEKEFEPAVGKRGLMEVRRLAEEKDARKLMSSPTGTPMERLYANHSNRLKALANKARLVVIKTPNPKQSASAKQAYKAQIDSLNIKLDRAQRNAPLERQANYIANANVKMRQDADPNMGDETLKKIKYQSLIQARIRTGAHKQRIEIEDDEWDAIQAGAISNSKLIQILNHANMESVHKHATPKTPVLMTPAKTDRAAQMLAQGYPRSEVAKHLGVSLSTLDNAIK